jgi:type III secretion system YscQ/HrcQ family protein
MSLELSGADADSVEALNHLLGRAQVSVLKSADQEYTWNWHERTDRPTDSGPIIGMALEAEGVQLAFWSRWTQRSELVADIDTDAFHGAARVLALTRRYSLLIDHLNSITGCSWLPREVRFDAPGKASEGQQSSAGFSVMDDRNEPAFKGWIRFDANAVHLLNRVQGRPGSREPAIAQVPSHLRICLTSPALTVEQLRSLVPQSAIALGSHTHGKIEVRLVSACGRYQVPASLEEDRVTVEGSLLRVPGAAFDNTKGLPMPIPPEASADTPGANQGVNVGDLPIELSFEIGHLNVALGELESSLRSGYTFSLNRELRHDSVVVRANGAVIASGELMKIGDMLAVRITGIESHGRR